ncbi:DUF2169 domain-containing protein [Fulvimarina sp. MAC8]|uniref:DUF2169 family type VI secretion system accessory protein n=1 Tax=Fulvimarina sp. MAC8 TaxID=3162874 RepID=UPI0032EF7A4E
MWAVDNTTPFAAEGYFVRDREGLENWVVALRASFDIRADGLVSMRETQPPVRLAPQYEGDGSEVLLAEAEICPFRPRVDFIVAGTACRPDMKAGRELEVLVDVAGRQKRARVSGPRRLRAVKRRRPEIEAAEPFESLALSWRHSLGGRDPILGDEATAFNDDNPAGRGWTTRWEDLPAGAELDLPQIEDTAAPVAIGKPLPVPFGFGAIQPHWRPRRKFAGTYDDAWRTNRQPLLPDDFDNAFYQSAPADQIFDLRGGEPVRVVNLSPHGELAFRLPQAIFEARTQLGRERIDTRFRLIGVHLDTAASTVEMIWNTVVPCHGRDMDVDRSTVRLRQIAGVSRS